MNNILKIREELKPSQDFFNTMLGVLSFSFSLSCLSMSNKWIALICIISSIFMITVLIFHNKPKISETLKNLREKKDKSTAEHEELKFIKEELFKNEFYFASNFGFIFMLFTLLYCVLNALDIFNYIPFII